MSHDNAGVLRSAQVGQKPTVEKKVKSRLKLSVTVILNCGKPWPSDPFACSELLARGVRKVTTGITGLWQPSVHSDVAF